MATEWSALVSASHSIYAHPDRSLQEDQISALDNDGTLHPLRHPLWRQQILGVCTSADAHWHHAEFTLLLYGLLVWTISSVQRMSSQNGYHWLHHMSFGKHLTLFLASGSLLCRATCPTHRPLLPYQRTIPLWCIIWL